MSPVPPTYKRSRERSSSSIEIVKKMIMNGYVVPIHSEIRAIGNNHKCDFLLTHYKDRDRDKYCIGTNKTVVEIAKEVMKHIGNVTHNKTRTINNNIEIHSFSIKRENPPKNIIIYYQNDIPLSITYKPSTTSTVILQCQENNHKQPQKKNGHAMVTVEAAKIYGIKNDNPIKHWARCLYMLYYVFYYPENVNENMFSTTTEGDISTFWTNVTSKVDINNTTVA